MAGREDNRIFVGGLAWETTERQLEDAFGRYGEIVECVVVVDRETGRPRGFGFITFADHRAMDDAITVMHGQELDGRVISVNKAKPKLGDEDLGGFEYGRDSISGGSYRGRERSAGHSDCFKCGRPGHFARECPLADGGGRFSSHFRSGRGGGGGGRFRMENYDDRFDQGRYGDRGQESRYERYDRYGNNDRYSERYASGLDSYGGGRYVNREVQTGYGRGRGSFRDGGLRGSGGPDRYGRGGSYRDRAGPYVRPRREEHLSSYERY
ncbi:hypothetical protein UlMin_042415 [Ulmus minor]